MSDLNFTVHKISLKDPESPRAKWSVKFPSDDIDVKLPVGLRTGGGGGVLLLEIVFSSEQEIANLKGICKISFKNKCLEEWTLEYGYVDARSAHTWNIELESSPLIDHMPFDVISGHVTIDVKLCENDSVFRTMKMLVFYQEQL